MTLEQQIITISMVVLATVATAFFAISPFSSRKGNAKVHYIFGKGAARRGVWPAGRLLLKRCFHFYCQPCPAGVDCHFDNRFCPFMETANALVHCSGHPLLYAACSVCVLKRYL